MSTPLETLLQSSVVKGAMFPPNSRYQGFDTIKMEMPDGRQVLYLERRFIPQPESLNLLQEHTVTQGERLYNITAHYLNDPEQFWRICDANRAMIPDQLTEQIGRRLRITLPHGVPGVPDA